MVAFHKKLPPASLSSLSGLHFLPLGGCGEIGMNANLYCVDDEWLMVDNGVTFSRYPDTVLMSDIRPFIHAVDVRERLKGLVITHAHEDHVGAVAYLWPHLQCPVYATPFTLNILRHKMREVGLKINCLHEIELEKDVQIGPYHVEFVSLTHSVPEPSALMIRTKYGNIFHTGDWKIDPEPLIGQSIDSNRMEKLGEEGVLALVCDSTNVFIKGVSGSEYGVRTTLSHLIAKCENKVILSCFSSNLARVKSAYEAAKKAGRKVCLVGRSLQRMVDAAFHCGYFDNSMSFLPIHEASTYPGSKLLIMTTGSQAEPMAALTRMSLGKHPLLHINEGDTVVFSSRVIPGNQEAISALQNRLIRMGVTLVVRDEDVEEIICSGSSCDDFQRDKEQWNGDTYIGDLHVSGHPCRDELAQIYKWLKPTIVVPVHGEDLHIKEQALLAKSLGIPHAIRPHNGQLFKLTPQGATCEGRFPTGRLAVDGNRFLEAEGSVLYQRMQLLDRGILDILLVFYKGQEGKFKTKILSHGVFQDDREKRHWKDVIYRLASEELDPNTEEKPQEGKREKQKDQGKNSGSSEGDKKTPRASVDLSERCFGLQKTIQDAFQKKWGKSPIVKVGYIFS